VGKRTRWVLVGLLALLAWAVFERRSRSRLAPPAGVVTVEQVLRWRPQTERVLVVSAGGEEYLCAVGPKAGLLPSGPSAYVFDGKGRLVGWTADAGDDPTFRNKWGFDRPVRELNLDAARRWQVRADARETSVPPPPATPAPLREIEMRSGVYLARVESHIVVRPDGSVRSERTMNKGLPGEQVEVRDGTLTSQQMEDLAASFVSWEDFESHYSGVPDGPEISIRYGVKTVEGGSALPREVLDIHRTLMEIASGLPVKGTP
jgi:hypothetical protein